MKYHSSSKSTRRKFLYNLGLTTLSLPALSSLYACSGKPSGKKEQSVNDGKKDKLGIALVGLGSYAGGQLAPALQQTEHCYLAGIVTGTPSKIPEWQEKYSIPDKNIYSYENFDSIRDNKDIDIVYVVLPNSMHAEYTIRAAQAGKHVICEKPMAITVEDCNRMIDACNKAGKMLSIGYRLHFEPYNLEMVRLAQEKEFGALKKMSSAFGIHTSPGIWRLNKELAGGGPLMDVGIYCVQAFCYVSGMEPLAVTAKEGPKTDLEKFKEVEESLTWQFEFPNSLVAEGMCSYSESICNLRAEAEQGWFQLEPAYYYGGLKGETSKGKINFPQVNQQARQMDDFALAIKNNRPSPVPGEMGRRDVKLLQAIYEAMQTGKRITL
ncbi:MAG: Gfo/Idh/MocA family oxidoreductase [Cyclobacteriaceae bacterium]|nr:Gfo/Idh/MocA family oxidoreductase [Cyclobacteriaceae bacterium]